MQRAMAYLSILKNNFCCLLLLTQQPTEHNYKSTLPLPVNLIAASATKEYYSLVLLTSRVGKFPLPCTSTGIR